MHCPMRSLLRFRRQEKDTLDKMEGNPVARPSTASDLPRSSSIVIGHATDQGQDRDYNEDSLLFWCSMLRRNHEYFAVGLAIVADGVGGHEGGEQASELATQIVSKQVLHDVYLPFLSSKAGAIAPRPVNEVLISAVEEANRAVKAQLGEAGTTLTAVLLIGNTAFFVHVGDSRAYLIHEDQIQHLTHDHSLVGRLVEVGAISEREALTHPHKNIIYRSIGQGDELQADWFSMDVPPNSYILLCTDGLWGSVTDPDIAAIVQQTADVQEASDDLVRTARAQGSTDDVTVLLVPWGSPADDG